jgi:metal transporter CNNM
MTRLEKVFMLEASTKLTFEHMLEIYRSGYTRIPVFDAVPQNIIGILYTKDLILVDPDDELELRTLVAFQGKANVQFILDSTPLNEVGCTCTQALSAYI